MFSAPLALVWKPTGDVGNSLSRFQTLFTRTVFKNVIRPHEMQGAAQNVWGELGAQKLTDVSGWMDSTQARGSGSWAESLMGRKLCWSLWNHCSLKLQEFKRSKGSYWAPGLHKCIQLSLQPRCWSASRSINLTLETLPLCWWFQQWFQYWTPVRSIFKKVEDFDALKGE